MSTKPITLEDIYPDRPTFELQSKPGKVFELRLPTLGDHAWLKKQYGSDERLTAIISNGSPDWPEVARIAYFLMREEDRAAFPAKSVTLTNEEGEQLEEKWPGHKVFLNELVGLEEGVRILGAVTVAISRSSPIIDEAVREGIKKNFPQVKLPESLIGRGSSTTSRPSTAGPRNTSKPARSGKSRGASKLSGKGATRGYAPTR
jgi:hypothetical protein